MLRPNGGFCAFNLFSLAEGGFPKGFAGAAAGWGLGSYEKSIFIIEGALTKDVPGGLGQFASQRSGRDDIVGLGQLAGVPALDTFIVAANQVGRFDKGQVAIAGKKRRGDAFEISPRKSLYLSAPCACGGGIRRPGRARRPSGRRSCRRRGRARGPCSCSSPFFPAYCSTR